MFLFFFFKFISLFLCVLFKLLKFFDKVDCSYKFCVLFINNSIGLMGLVSILGDNRFFLHILYILYFCDEHSFINTVSNMDIAP